MNREDVLSADDSKGNYILSFAVHRELLSKLNIAIAAWHRVHPHAGILSRSEFCRRVLDIACDDVIDTFNKRCTLARAKGRQYDGKIQRAGADDGGRDD